MSSKITEVMPARFEGGTFSRINEVLGEGEPRSDFIREATEREIVRRTVERNIARATRRRRVLYDKKRA